MDEHLLKYDDFLNEGIISDVGDKIKLHLKNLSFQKKEQFLRKMYLLACNGSFAMMFIAFSILLIQILGPDWKKYLSSAGYIINSFSVMNLLITIFFPIARRKLIRKKMRELSEDFRNDNFRQHIYAIIGDRRNIKSFIDKIKNDGIITDLNILDYQDITLIDFSGTIKDKKTKEILNTYVNIDPYGEETWEDEQPGYERDEIRNYKSLHRFATSNKLENIYNIRLRRIIDYTGIYDTFMTSHHLFLFSPKNSKKNKKKDIDNYNYSLQRLNQLDGGD